MRRYPKDTIKKVLNLADQGFQRKVIARRMNLPVHTVYDMVHYYLGDKRKSARYPSSSPLRKTHQRPS